MSRIGISSVVWVESMGRAGSVVVGRIWTLVPVCVCTSGLSGIG